MNDRGASWPVRRTAARLFLAVAVVYTLIIIYFLASGPFDFSLLGVRIRLGNLEKPLLILATAIGLFASISYESKKPSPSLPGKLAPALIAVAVVLAYSSAISKYVNRHDTTMGFLVCVGDRFAGEGLPDPNVPVMQNSNGYDGQFFYRMAFDPLLSDVTAAPRVDIPAYRQQRILYSLAAYALSFGNAWMVPYLLPALNLFAISVITFVAGKIAVESGMRPEWGLVLGAYPGFLVSLLRDLPEPMAVMFVVLGIYCIRKQKYSIAALALGLGALTRETTLIFAGSIGLAGLWHIGQSWLTGRKPDTPRVPLYVGAIPIVAFALWQIVIYSKWGVFSFQQGSHNLGFPFMGAYEQVKLYIRGLQIYYRDYDLFLLASFAATGAAAGLNIFSKNLELHEKIALVFYLVLATLLTWVVYEAREGYTRAMAELYLFCWLALLLSGSRLRFPLAACWAAMLYGMADIWVDL